MASFLLAPVATYAADITSANCTTKDGKPGVKLAIPINGQDCIAKDNDNDPKTTNPDVNANPIFIYFKLIMLILSAGVGIAVVGGIVWGGIIYTTAQGNASQTQKGISVIVNAVIGLFLFLFMFAIINFLVPGGLFS